MLGAGTPSVTSGRSTSVRVSTSRFTVVGLPMKYHGMFEKDNKQRGGENLPITVVFGK